MAQRMILYTSQSEGITLGASGDTWMECLLALSDEFGEGVLPLYEKTREELENVAQAVAEAFAEELDGIHTDIADAVERQTAEEATSAEPTQRDKVLAAINDVAESDREPADGGGEQQPLDTSRPSGSDEDDAVRPAGGNTDASTDQPVCTVCGATTTPDFAKLTKLEHGEVRCPDCTP